jgi:predicted transcriptional regulator
MVKKTPPKSAGGERQWRSARASLRMHDDLRSTLDFIAQSDRRTVSQVLERFVLDRVRDVMATTYDDDGVIIGNRELRLKHPDRKLV